LPIANFEALAGGICELADIGIPHLEPDARGTLAFSMRLQGIVVSGVELARDRGSRAIFMAELGALPEAQALRSARLLLQANTFLPGEDNPRFSRHPQTADILLQWPCRYDGIGMSMADAFDRVLQLVQAARQWRADPLGERASGQALPPRAAHEADGAMRAAGVQGGGATSSFVMLYQQVCEAAGSPAAELTAVAGAYAFRLRYGATEVTVVHAPLVTRDAASVALRLGPAWDAGNLAVAMTLLDANFVLTTQPAGARFCLGVDGKSLLLQYPFSLVDPSAGQLLAQLGQLADTLVGLESRVLPAMPPAPAEGMAADVGGVQ